MFIFSVIFKLWKTLLIVKSFPLKNYVKLSKQKIKQTEN